MIRLDGFRSLSQPSDSPLECFRLPVLHMSLNAIPTQEPSPSFTLLSIQFQLFGHPTTTSRSKALGLVLKRFLEEGPLRVKRGSIERGWEV